MRRAIGFLAASLAVAPLLAVAQERPPATPLRDVDVTYAAPGGVSQRLRWQAASQRMRLDPSTQALYLVVDYATHRMAVVRPAERSVVDLPAPAGVLPGGAGAAFTRRGQDQVAGLACTLWDTSDVNGQAVTACITADGVMLRAATAGRVLVEARAVSYAPQDAETFRPPDGFSHVTGASAGAKEAK